jgi:RNA polymerase sigma factor (sigma-70 family)
MGAAAIGFGTARWTRAFPSSSQSRPTEQGKRLDADAALVDRCLRGDAAAWEQLVRDYSGRVYTLCFRFTGRDAEAEELSQEVFLRVFRTLASYRSGDGAFVTWLSRVTRNLLIDHYRRSKLERATDSLDDRVEVIETHASASAKSDALLAGREASEILQSALARLSPELREAIILRDLQEMEYREIADVLQVPEGTVKSRLSRGRAELARVLRQRKVIS